MGGCAFTCAEAPLKHKKKEHGGVMQPAVQLCARVMVGEEFTDGGVM